MNLFTWNGIAVFLLGVAGLMYCIDARVLEMRVNDLEKRVERLEQVVFFADQSNEAS